MAIPFRFIANVDPDLIAGPFLGFHKILDLLHRRRAAVDPRRSAVGAQQWASFGVFFGIATVHADGVKARHRWPHKIVRRR